MTMHDKFNRLKALGWFGLFAAALVVISVIIISGCTDTLKGDINENTAPIVYFVNIPPDYTNFAHNPEVYWFGSDADGQIDYYRYFVATADEIGSVDRDVALQFAAAAHDTVWTYVDYDPGASDPQTTHVIRLTADADDPVNRYVLQFIFLQAFDDDARASTIAVKCLNRNDHPPDTRIANFLRTDTPFVNAVVPGGIVTGVKLGWEGSDVRDYDEQGLVAPPFEFEWKLYGPYSEEDTITIFSEFIDTLFFPVTMDTVYYHGDTMWIHDSTLVDDGDSVYWEVSDTFVAFEPGTGGDLTMGYFRDVKLVDTSEQYFGDRLVRQSASGVGTWVQDTQDTIYNVYEGIDTGPTTITRFFIFTVRSRDDALVADLTPAFTVFKVIEPKYERDVLVIDFTPGGAANYGRVNTIDSSMSMRRNIFGNFVTRWNPDVEFNPNLFYQGEDGDYMWAEDWGRGMPLGKLLSYKVVILYSDHCIRSKLMIGPMQIKFPEIFKAIDAGVNAWVTARALLTGQFTGPFSTNYPAVPPEIVYYFGVTGQFFSFWSYFLHGVHPFNGYEEVRMEDFVGAYSMDESRWPNIDVDTALLHARYSWWYDPYNPIAVDLPWVDSIAALGEINWCQRQYGTEVMYLYKSKYEANHFLGYPYTIDGTPVAHRYETNLFRTVWFQFTPLPIDSLVMQEVVNDVLDWLYDPDLSGSTVSEKRYPDAVTKISLDEAYDFVRERDARYEALEP